MNDKTVANLNKIFDLGDMVDESTGEVISTPAEPEVDTEVASIVAKVASIAPTEPIVAPIESVALTGEVMPAEGANLPAVIDEETPEDRAAREAEEDFVFSRGAIKGVAEEAHNAMNRAFDVAQQTDNARSFEVAAELVKATLEAHRELREAHKARLALNTLGGGGRKKEPSVNIENGIVFNGTPEELLRMIQPERK